MDGDNMANLFAIDGESGEQEDLPELDVIKVKFERVVKCSYRDLFEGFNEIRVLTYSLSPKQIDNVMHLFDYGEVVIGSPSQVRKDLATLLATQKYHIDTITKTPYLQRMIRKGTMRFSLVNGAHDKMYLLSAKNGRRRVILGSANFSQCAWDGSQSENIVYMDETEAYNYCLSLYEAFRDDSNSVAIGVDAKPIQDDGKNLKELPIIKRIIEKKDAIVVREVDGPEDAEYRLSIDISAAQWRKRLEQAGVGKSPDGYTMITAKNITVLEKNIRKEYAEKQKKTAGNSAFRLDYLNQIAIFDGQAFDMNPSDEDVKKDIEGLFRYVQGAEKFSGNTSELKTIYWKILIYMFISPFIAKFRLAYNPYAPENSVGKHFPMYMVLRGGKNGGKSSIIKTGHILMFGKPLEKKTEKILAPNGFEILKETVKGIPVLIDEVSNNRAKYLPQIVKNEANLLGQRIDDHGTFIMTSNELQNLKPDLLKRMIVFQIDNQMSDDTSIKEESKLYALQKRLGNAFYRRYLHEVFPSMSQLLDYIRRYENVPEGWHPDIFEPASSTFIRVIRDCGFDVPRELTVFTWKDYMSEIIKSEKAVRDLVYSFNLSPQFFKVDKKSDSLTIELGEQSMTKTQIEALTSGLPTDVEAMLFGNVLCMKWSTIKNYSGCDFLKEGGLTSMLSHIKRIFGGD